MIKKILWFFEDLCWNARCSYNFWLHGPYGLVAIIEMMPFRYLVKYLRKYGAIIGNNSIIDTGIIIHRPDKNIPFKNLTIGDNCYIGRKILFDLSDRILIDHDVGLGAGCQFWTHKGDYVNELTDRVSDYKEAVLPIKVKKCVIIYSASIVSPGITIGEYARVGSNSFVNRDVEPYAFVGGVPAKFIKKREIDVST